jgi:molecular chaperone IbpA
MEVNMTNLSTFLNNAIGFENMFDRFDYLTSINSGFPHYNIRKETEGKYVIELALAGYKKDEVSVEVKDGVLIIEGKSKEDLSNYVHQGIAKRSFKRQFQLADYVECKGGKLEDGMLNVQLEYNPPESKKPKKILID